MLIDNGRSELFSPFCVMNVIEIAENTSINVIHEWIGTLHPSSGAVSFLEREDYRCKLHNETRQSYPGGLSLYVK